jgi:pimeloyl-ACP methyl ester carboxylesterase
MQLGGLEAVHVTPTRKRRGPQVLLFHGLGLGAWSWEKHQAVLAEEGVETFAVDLPGHGAGAGEDVDLEEVLRSARRVAESLDKPAIVGHGMGALVGQVVATRVKCASLALIAPLPPAGVRLMPAQDAVRAVLTKLPALAAGRALAVNGVAEDGTLACVPDGERAAIAARITAWPNTLTRDLLLRRPAIARDAIDCPVLVTYGFQDPYLRLDTVRLLADHYNALLWRFDDLAHLPPLEAGGDRHALKLAGWLKRPKRRRLDEIDAFGPGEGVGQEVREQRRGFRRTRTKV